MKLLLVAILAMPHVPPKDLPDDYCFLHKMKAQYTGHNRNNGAECEYNHHNYFGGQNHSYWVSCRVMEKRKI